MARYEIVIDDNDRAEVTDDTAWTANLYLVDERTGKTSDALAVGFSGTPAAALEHMLMAITEGDADESAAAFLETGAADACRACGRDELACPCDGSLT